MSKRTAFKVLAGAIVVLISLFGVVRCDVWMAERAASVSIDAASNGPMP